MTTEYYDSKSELYNRNYYVIKDKITCHNHALMIYQMVLALALALVGGSFEDRNNLLVTNWLAQPL